MTQTLSEKFCGHCGQDWTAGGHDRCDRAALLEPPRYCGTCRRRMVVQVTPTGWAARCSHHGEVSGAQS